MSSTGLIIRPLGPVVAALSRLGQRLFQAPQDNIRGIENDAWYSPLQPVQPIASEGTEPRGFQYWAGQNLLWTPRADAEYSAADLKQLATYPLARICIENVKDMVSDAEWEVQLRAKPGENKKQRSKRAEGDDTLKKLTKLFEYPDREHDWASWVRPLLDDMLVIDAASILLRKTFKGELAEMAVLRGESIVRYIDTNGFTPLPPSPAYAQLWWGIPLVNLSMEQLVYRPRNIVPRNTVASQLYGMSPTEQLAEELKVGSQRLAFTLAYYTEGSTPGVMQVVPKGTPPDKIAEAMQWMNSELAGNLAARRQWRLVQGFNEPGKPDQIEFTKEALLADAYDDLHTRRVCFGYGTSPQRLMKMIRTEGKASGEAADVEGLRPWVRWLKGTIDFIIQRRMGFEEYEIVFDLFQEPDQQKEATALKLLVGSATKTPNEAREQLGEEPYPAPEADMLGIITGTGFVPLGQSAAKGNQDGSTGSESDSKEPKPGGDGAEPGSRVKPNGHGASKARCRTHKGYDDACVDCARAETWRLEKQSPPQEAINWRLEKIQEDKILSRLIALESLSREGEATREIDAVNRLATALEREPAVSKMPEINVTMPEIKLNPHISLNPEIKLPSRVSTKKGKAHRLANGDMEFELTENNES